MYYKPAVSRSLIVERKCQPLLASPRYGRRGAKFRDANESVQHVNKIKRDDGAYIEPEDFQPVNWSGNYKYLADLATAKATGRRRIVTTNEDLWFIGRRVGDHAIKKWERVGRGDESEAYPEADRATAEKRGAAADAANVTATDASGDLVEAGNAVGPRGVDEGASISAVPRADDKKEGLFSRMWSRVRGGG